MMTMTTCIYNYYKGSFLDYDKEGFDIIVGNPPYQSPQIAKGKRGGGDILWNKFLKKSIEIIKDKGKLIFVHPPSWRKPESKKSKNKDLFKLMTNNQIHYLEIHNAIDGKKIFNAATRYDFYFLEKIKPYKKTKIKDENGVISYLNLKEWSFLPNSNFDKIKKLLNNNGEKYDNIIFDRSKYGTDYKWVTNTKNDIYKYPLIHSTPKSGIRYMYSSRNDKGHFGISKVIFGESGINHVIIDMEGKYGMTQHSMAIKVDNIDEAKQIKKVLLSDNFKVILKSTSWGNFRIDWRMFNYFKKDWWKFV